MKSSKNGLVSHRSGERENSTKLQNFNISKKTVNPPAQEGKILFSLGFLWNSFYIVVFAIYFLVIFIFTLLNNDFLEGSVKKDFFRGLKSVEIAIIVISLCLDLANIYMAFYGQKSKRQKLLVTKIKKLEFFSLITICIVDIASITSEPIGFLYLEKSLNYLLRLWYFALKWVQIYSVYFSKPAIINEKIDPPPVEENEDETKKRIAITLENSFHLLEHHPISSDIEWILEKFLKTNKVNGISPKRIQKKDIKEERTGLRNDTSTDGSKAGSRVLSSGDIEKAESFLHSCVDDPFFDIFQYCNLSVGRELILLAQYIMKINHWYSQLSINEKTFSNFIGRVQKSYYSNPYHNSAHATDVVQTLYVYIKTLEFKEVAKLTEMECMAMIISGAIHDLEHPGKNNMFLVNNKDYLAIRYNDKSVLESHHVAKAFLIISEERFNIFENFSRDDLKKIRQQIISMVIATDMSLHFSNLKTVEGKVNTENYKVEESDKQIMMDYLVHVADISNPSKSKKVCYEWTDRILKEFFNQGDEEKKKGLPVTYLCDRLTVNRAKSQIGFIDFIILPSFTNMEKLLPKSSMFMESLKRNKECWSKDIEEDEKYLQKVISEHNELKS